MIKASCQKPRTRANCWSGRSPRTCAPRGPYGVGPRQGRLAFQRIDCCVYCGESTRTEDEAAVPELRGPGLRRRPGAWRAGVGLLSTDGPAACASRSRGAVCGSADQLPPTPRRRRRPRPLRRAAGNHAVDGAELGRPACTRGGQKSRRVAQQRRTVLCGNQDAWPMAWGEIFSTQARSRGRRDAEPRAALREAQATAARA